MIRIFTVYFGLFFYPWKLDKSVYPLRGVWFILILQKVLCLFEANSVDHDNTPHSMATDLGSHF